MRITEVESPIDKMKSWWKDKAYPKIAGKPSTSRNDPRQDVNPKVAQFPKFLPISSLQIYPKLVQLLKRHDIRTLRKTQQGKLSITMLGLSFTDLVLVIRVGSVTDWNWDFFDAANNVLIEFGPTIDHEKLSGLQQALRSVYADESGTVKEAADAGNTGWTKKRNRSEVIKALRRLPQPITVDGGGYSYTANMRKDPLLWTASDGSPIDLRKYGSDIKEIDKWFDLHVAEEWDRLFDPEIDNADYIEEVIEELMRDQMLTAGMKQPDQEKYELKRMRGGWNESQEFDDTEQHFDKSCFGCGYGYESQWKAQDLIPAGFRTGFGDEALYCPDCYEQEIGELYEARNAPGKSMSLSKATALLMKKGYTRTKVNKNKHEFTNAEGKKAFIELRGTSAKIVDLPNES